MKAEKEHNTQEKLLHNKSKVDSPSCFLFSSPGDPSSDEEEGEAKPFPPLLLVPFSSFLADARGGQQIPRVLICFPLMYLPGATRSVGLASIMATWEEMEGKYDDHGTA